MGNVKSRMKRRKKEEYGRPLPPELLYEITKFIPLTRFEKREIIKKKEGKTVQWTINIKNAIIRKKEPISNKWDCPKMYIGPENVKLLQCNSILTTYLRFRCNRILQIINDINNDYIYEKFPNVPIPTWETVIIIIKKGTNYRPLTMCEMMRHICFCRKFEFKMQPFILSENYKTLPMDFEPEYFIDFLIEFTKKTPHPEMISKCIIHLNNEQQCLKALNTLNKYGSRRDLTFYEFYWSNWHKPEHRYELKLIKYANPFILHFDTLYYPEYQYRQLV